VAVLPVLTSGCGLFGDEADEEGGTFELGGGVEKPEMTEEELLALCAELVEDGQTKAMKAQSRVESLQNDLASKEEELAKLKAEDIKDEKRRAAATRKWREMEAELETLRSNLTEAESERDTLRNELKETLVQLDNQIAETKKFKKKAKVYRAKAIQYKTESTENLWKSFGAEAKVEICDRGSRKRHEKCHSAVQAALTPAIRGKFEQCVDTYQAVPVLRQLEKGEKIPHLAQELPNDNKFTKKGWVIIWCDPTLPEAGDSILSAPDPELDGPDEPAGRDILSDDPDDMDF
jgi:myosin heavy subunit